MQNCITIHSMKKNTEQKERIDKKWEENIMMSLVNYQ